MKTIKFRTDEYLKHQKYCRITSRLGDLWIMFIILSIISFSIVIYSWNSIWIMFGILCIGVILVINYIHSLIFENIKSNYPNIVIEKNREDIHKRDVEKYGESLIKGKYVEEYKYIVKK